MTQLERQRRRVAARCTAILDSVQFPRTSWVFWCEEKQSFLVTYRTQQPPGELVEVERVKFLGPTRVMAINSARRERAKALAPERRAAAREGLAGFLDVVGAVTPLVGGIVGKVASGGLDKL